MYTPFTRPFPLLWKWVWLVRLTQATDYPSFTKGASRQLTAAPYLGGMHGISLGHYYKKRPCQPYAARVY